MPSQDSIGSALLVTKKQSLSLRQIKVLSDKCVVMNEDITKLKEDKSRQEGS